MAGRRINDGMGKYVVSQLVKQMIRQKMPVSGAKVLVLGLTFKENCPDIRNTKVVDILNELTEYGMQADVYDPWIDHDEARHEYGLTPLQSPEPGQYDAIVLAVAHQHFKTLGAAGIRAFGKATHVLYDLKYLLPREQSDLRL